MCEVKLIDRNTSEVMSMLGLTVQMEMTANSNALRWFGHVLRAEDNPVNMALIFEVRGTRKKGCPKGTWKEKVKDS